MNINRTTTTNPAPVKLHRVRAGWYETTKGEPQHGTICAYSYVSENDGSTWWNITRYVTADDGGLDNISTGFVSATLAGCRNEIASLLNYAAVVTAVAARYGHRRCVECNRLFDMGNPADADEYTNGHDCEA